MKLNDHKSKNASDCYNNVLNSYFSPDTFNKKLQNASNTIVELLDVNLCNIWAIKSGDLCNSGCPYAEIPESPFSCNIRVKCLHLIATSGYSSLVSEKIVKRLPYGQYGIGRFAAGNDSKFQTNDVTEFPFLYSGCRYKEMELPLLVGYRIRNDSGETIGVLTLLSRNNISLIQDDQLERFAEILGNLFLNERPNKASMVLLKKDFSIENANRQFCGKYGSPIGHRCFEIIRKRSEPCKDCPAIPILETAYLEAGILTSPNGKKCSIVYPFKYRERKRLGLNDQVPVTKHSEEERAPVKDEKGKYVNLVGVERDTSDYKKVEEKLTIQMRHTKFIKDVGETIVKGGAFQENLQRCAEIMVKYVDAAFARIWIFNEEEETLELQASAGMHTHIDGAHGRIPLGEFKIGLIAQERKPHLTNNVIGDPRVNDQKWAKREGMAAFAGYPLIVQDELVGVMALFARRRLSEITIEALSTVSNQISLSIYNHFLEERFNLFYKKKERESCIKYFDSKFAEYSLTPQERNVAKLILDGKSDQEICSALYISPHTVKRHTQNIFEKTGVNSRVKLMALFRCKNYSL